jgi:hypothetical protein
MVEGAMVVPGWVIWIVGIVAALFALDRLCLWMEAKGWLYYRKVKRKSSAAGILIGGNVFDPGAGHILEAQQERAGEEDEDDGDDESKRSPEDRTS